MSSPAESGYGPDHLPYGVFSPPGGEPRVGARIGDEVIDLAALAAAARRSWAPLANRPVLNPLMAAGPAVWADARGVLIRAVTDPVESGCTGSLRYPLDRVRLHLPFDVADFVDFYASEHHARALGTIMRPGDEPLRENWKHLPVGYHGRAGTVVPSGTTIVRPCGQRRPATEIVASGPTARPRPSEPHQPSGPPRHPTFGPSTRLDVEAELGFVVGVGSQLGSPVPVTDFPHHVFGVCLVNDWSARDLQAWEYIPLGPFLGKSFATSISHWITPLAALAAARVPPPPRSHPLLPYIADPPGEPWALDITLAIEWNGTVVSRPPAAGLYYTGAQMLAHLTVNGARVRCGDLYASGTVSGARPEESGSFVELSDAGRRAVELAGGVTRTFLEDGDTVTISGWAPSPGGGRLRLGDVTGTIAPARI